MKREKTGLLEEWTESHEERKKLQVGADNQVIERSIYEARGGPGGTGLDATVMLKQWQILEKMTVDA